MKTKWPPLSVTHPAIAADWDTANNDKTPEEVTLASKFVAHWVCQSGHRELKRVDNRVRDKGCLSCKSEEVLKESSLAVNYPEVAKQWHPTKNGDLTPDRVAPTGTLKAWWQCDNNKEHVWEAFVRNRTWNGAGCPYCSGHWVSDANSLAKRFPEIAKEMHPEKNGELTGDQISWASNRAIWWLCERGHAWFTVVEERTLKGHGCPFCANYYVTDENRLSVRFPEIAAEFHKTKNRRLWPKELGSFKTWTNKRIAPAYMLDPNSKRQLLPSDISQYSSQEVWWQCKNSEEHVWKDVVQHRTMGRAGCPFCAGTKACSDNNLAVLYPALAKQWHSRNGPLLPTQVTPRSNAAVWWRCFRYADHVWEARVYDVVKAYDSGKSPCVRCQARGERSGKRERA